MSSLQAITLLSPTFSAIIIALLAYKFAIKNKKFDILYANKIPAFKEIAFKLTSYKSYCWGKYTYLNGIEFAPYYNELGGALSYRKEIVNVVDLNSIFLSQRNKRALEEFINGMSILCNIELQISGSNNSSHDYSEAYEYEAKKAEKLIKLLYDDLNLN